MLNNDIFGANNHSDWRISYKSVDSMKRTELSSILSMFYGIDQIVDIAQVKESELNSNNFKVVTPESVYLLRRNIETTNLKLIEGTAVLMNNLSGAGVKVPRPIFSNERMFVSIYNSMPYILFEFSHGEHFQGSETELASAGREIGLLDCTIAKQNDKVSSSKFVMQKESKDLRACGLNIWENLRERARKKAQEEPEVQFHKEFLDAVPFINDTIVENLEKKPTKPEMGLVHYDMHPHNLLTNGKEITAILDFDSLRYLEKMRATSFAIHRLVRQCVVSSRISDYEQSVRKLTILFLENYRNAGCEDKLNLESIPYYIKDEALARLTFAMKKEYVYGDSSWRRELYKQISHIKEAGYYKI